MNNTQGAPATNSVSPVPTGKWLQFLREKFWLIATISAAVVLPCFWHRRIEAGDLGSHTYNAWLAQLIEHGEAPGLYLAHQWNNILLDVALVRFGSVVGFAAAEKILIPLCVLIFFWGAFALISALAGRKPWFLTPFIAMVAYGWTLQMGFLNYYLSLGLAFISIALLLRGHRSDWLLGVVLTGLVLLSHPVGLLWLLGTAAYVMLANRLSKHWRWMLFPAALAAILALHVYVSHQYRVFDPVFWHFYLFAGPDQLIVYGHRYRILAAVVLLISTGIALGSFREWKTQQFWARLRMPLELWLLAAFSISMAWGDIVLPKYATGFTFLPPRLSSITAVTGLCVLACVQPRKWHLAALLGCGVVFFSWMYQDTGLLNRMEQQAESLVSGLPYGKRVVSTIWGPPGWRIGPEHIVDRACIGRCFTYSNYEPSTRQFRVRIGPEGSPIVMSSPAKALAVREGRYVVQPADLPIAQIYQCNGKDLSRLCIRELTAGEVNGSVGYHP